MPDSNPAGEALAVATKSPLLIRSARLFLAYLDGRAVVHVATVFATLYMTYEGFEWAKAFAVISTKDAVSVGAIIIAVTGPISALQGYVLKNYGDNRGGASQ